jgi:hypothetical protein
MIHADSIKSVRAAVNELDKAERLVREAKRHLVDELHAARVMGNASLSELAAIVGVSRQRIHQLTKGSD